MRFYIFSLGLIFLSFSTKAVTVRTFTPTTLGKNVKEYGCRQFMENPKLTHGLNFSPGPVAGGNLLRLEARLTTKIDSILSYFDCQENTEIYTKAEVDSENTKTKTELITKIDNNLASTNNSIGALRNELTTIFSNNQFNDRYKNAVLQVTTPTHKEILTKINTTKIYSEDEINKRIEEEVSKRINQALNNNLLK